MPDSGKFNADAVRALGLAGAAASAAAGPEEALWTITRALPELLGDRAAHLESGNLKPGESQQFACCCFVVTSDAKHNLLVAPVNFGRTQRHQKIDIALGHPGHVVKTRQPVLLANTDHHQSFVKILETFRAGSALFAPLLWREEAIGVIVCAAQARNTFCETDLAVHVAFSHLAAAQWIAHGGLARLATLAK